jgi:hypothetical protein
VASVIEGVFTDLGPAFQAALVNAGETADLIYDPAGVWPDLSGYNEVLVTFSDNWWGTIWSPTDEDVLAAYLDAGGCVFIIGQDYLYFRGTNIGFPMDYLGVCDYVDDLNFGDTQVDWTGTAGGPLDGQSGTIFACYASNSFYTDQVFPCVQGLVEWTSAQVPTPVEGGSVMGSVLVGGLRLRRLGSARFGGGGSAQRVRSPASDGGRGDELGFHQEPVQVRERGTRVG